jgi:hypothetical protein
LTQLKTSGMVSSDMQTGASGLINRVLRRCRRAAGLASGRTISFGPGLIFLVLSTAFASVFAASLDTAGRHLNSIVKSGPGEAASDTSVSIVPVTETWNAREEDTLEPGAHRIGAALRARYIDWQSIYSDGLNADPAGQLLSTRVQISLDYRRSRTLRLFALLNNESLELETCEGREAGFGEISLENLYVEVLEPLGLPLAMHLGRQNLLYGDGWLIAEGTPLDRSRTFYFNGLLLTSSIPSWSFDVFALRDPRRDNYLPRINNKRTDLIEVDESAWGIVARREPSPGTALRYSAFPYYIFKKESHAGRTARIHTVGTRIGFGLGRGDAFLEFAYQGGKVPQIDRGEPLNDLLSGPQAISAVAGQARLEARLAPPVPLELAAGYVYLSGDDIKTRNKFEGWNPLFGRWPIWGELYALATAQESFAQPMGQTIAYWQNLSMPFLSAACDICPTLRLEGRYMWLDAPHPLATFDRLFDPSIEGPTHRGTAYTLKMSWRAEGLFDGHVLYESFSPGDYYPDASFDGGLSVKRESATYVRVEVSRSL